MRRETRLMITGAGIMAVILAVGVFFGQRGPQLPADFKAGAPGPEVTIEVVAGASGSEIGQILLAKGVVASSAAFFAAAVVDSRSSKIAPGSHLIQTNIPAVQALAQLLDPKRITNLIRIREGAWTTEIVAQLEQVGFEKSEILQALNQVKLPSGFSGTEGVFFPAQYSFGQGTSALEALQAMVDRFSRTATASGIAQGAKDFTPMQLLTIASLVQAEGGVEDFTRISQVVRNRLKIGMPLQFDSTVHFVQGTRGKIFLSTDSTTTPSLYNTYIHYGLPPGPIGNPGLKAMEAALQPLPGDWLYFITVAPNDTRFTNSHDEFLQWKNLYKKNLRDGVFGDSQ